MTKLATIQSVLILPSVDGAEALLLVRGGGAVRGVAKTLWAEAERPCALIVPGQDVRALQTDIPAGTKANEREAIARFAHEDALATDPGGLHVVLQEGTNGMAETRLISAACMDRWTDAFDAAAILTDYDVVGALGDAPIRLLDRIVQPATSEQAGYALDPDWYDGTPPRPDEGALSRAIFMALDGAGPTPPNLRCGAYRRRMSVDAGPWARIAALAVICGLLGLGVSWAETRAIKSQAAAVSEQARTDYSLATGLDAPDDFVRSLRSQSAPSQGSPAFLDLSQILFDALAERPDIQVERLSFEARENRLRLRLIYPDFDAASALESTVRGRGGLFLPGGVREQGGQFIGDAALALEGGS